MVNEKSAWLHHLGGGIGFDSGGDYRTRYLHAGEGDNPPILFLHGIGGHAEAFLKNVRPLSDQLPDQELYAVDFIGHGYSDAPDEIDYTLSDYVEQVVGFIRNSPYERAHVFGESLGGAVAIHLGMANPELVASLGLITPAGLHTFEVENEDVKEESDSGLESLYDRTMKMLEEGVTKSTVRERLSWLFVNNTDNELVDIRHEIYQREAVQRVMPTIYQTALLDGYDYYTREDLRSLDIPTLLVHTEHNPSSKKEQAEIAHEQLPNSDYKLLEESGHWPQWEEPERFNEIVTNFITSL